MFNKFLINRTNLISNIKQVKKNNSSSKICAMVKANAYGVGEQQVVEIIEPFIDYFGVACFFEAEKIKRFTSKEILIVGALEYGHINQEYNYTCNSIDDLKYLACLNVNVKIHLKINTGMNRFGFKNIKEFKQAIKIIKNSKLNLKGVFTHFATADNFINLQMERFLKFVNIAKQYKEDILVHADNSIVNEIKNHNLDMVRIGFDLYNNSRNNFLPVVEIISKVVQINKVKKNELVGYNYRFVAHKSMKVAIVPVGYADGFGLEYIGFNLKINNVDCKVLNVCMDCFMLDVSKIKIKKGDDIFLLSKNNTLTRFAEYSGVSEYQVMTNFSKIRASRILV